MKFQGLVVFFLSVCCGARPLLCEFHSKGELISQVTLQSEPHVKSKIGVLQGDPVYLMEQDHSLFSLEIFSADHEIRVYSEGVLSSPKDSLKLVLWGRDRIQEVRCRWDPEQSSEIPLLCGGHYNQMDLKFDFNPISGHYSLRSPDDVIMVYIKPMKFPGFAIHLLESSEDNQNKKFTTIYAAMYDGLLHYESSWQGHDLSLSCVPKNQILRTLFF